MLVSRNNAAVRGIHQHRRLAQLGDVALPGLIVLDVVLLRVVQPLRRCWIAVVDVIPAVTMVDAVFRLLVWRCCFRGVCS